MLSGHAKKHTIILSGAALLAVFACAISATDVSAENSETACSQVPQSEAEYCIDIDNTFSGRGLRNVVVTEGGERLYASIKPGTTTANAGDFGIVGNASDSPTNYYYATNESTPENGLPLIVTGSNAGLLVFTTSGAVDSVGLALVDADGYLLAPYECRIIGRTSAWMNDDNYLRCLLSEPADGETKIPKRGAILRLYYRGQIPEERPYVEPEPEPEPEEPTDNEAQDDSADDGIENVETADSTAKYAILLALSAAGTVGLASVLARAKRG